MCNLKSEVALYSYGSPQMSSSVGLKRVMWNCNPAEFIRR